MTCAAHNYYFKQIDLGCLESLQQCDLGKEDADYSLCLRFAFQTGNWRTSLAFMFERFGGLTFTSGEAS